MRTRAAGAIRALVAFALAATSFGAASCGRGDRLQGILLISIDSLRADHLGCYGYGRPTSPRLDALAREGTFFHTAVSTTSWTLPAHMSLLTGLLPEAHGVQKMSQRLDPKRACLAEILREAGFRTGAVVSSPLLDKLFGFDRGFESYENFASLSPVMGSAAGDAWGAGGGGRPSAEATAGGAAIGGAPDPSHADTSGARVVGEATAWLRAHGKEPFFLFVHLWEPHYDYIPPAPFDTLFAGPPARPSVPMHGFIENDSIRAGMDPEALRYVLSQYDGEIAYTDQLVGRLLDALAAMGLDRRTLVVVTADHGEEFFEHGGKGHQRTLFDEVILVPLIARGPGVARRPEGLDGQASLIDVAPTLLAAAGAAAPPEMRGVDLAARWGAGGDARAGAGASGTRGAAHAHAVSQLEGNATTPERRYCRWFSVRTPTWKSIEDCDGAFAIYDLARDPGELAPRAAAAGDTSAAAREASAVREAVRLHAASLPRRGVKPVPLDADALERLRRLGYVD